MSEKTDFVLTMPTPLAKAASKRAADAGLSRQAWIRLLVSVATGTPQADDSMGSYAPRMGKGR
jgi:hypothetical protein